MRPVHWLVVERADLPGDQGWLAASERHQLGLLTVDHRRQDWLLGRWAAKRLVQSCQADGQPLAAIEILPRPDGSPAVVVDGRDSELSLSLSHRAGFAMAAVGWRGAVGCDLELVENRSSGFVEDYFSLDERRAIAGSDAIDRVVLVNGMWAAKECVLKMLRKGLTVDTRQLTVLPETIRLGVEWTTFAVTRGDEVAAFRGWWRRWAGYVQTAVSDPPTGIPVEITLRRRAGG